MHNVLWTIESCKILIIWNLYLRVFVINRKKNENFDLGSSSRKSVIYYTVLKKLKDKKKSRSEKLKLKKKGWVILNYFVLIYV